MWDRGTRIASRLKRATVGRRRGRRRIVSPAFDRCVGVVESVVVEG
jgi:hypothetical protein